MSEWQEVGGKSGDDGWSVVGAPKAKATAPRGFTDAPLGAVIAEPVMAMGSAMIAKPASDVVGLAALGWEGARRAGLPLPEVDTLGIKQRVQGAMTYQPRTEVGALATEYNPLSMLGKGISWLGEQGENIVAPSGSGPWQTALGHGVNEGLTQAAGFLGFRAPSAATATRGALRESAENWMSSALKPGVKARQTGKADAAIDTLLTEGINVTRGGAEKMRSRVDDLNDAIATRIQGSPAIIDKFAVGNRLQDLIDRFQKQVNPLSDVAAIQKSWNEFLDHPLLNGRGIPVAAAQEMKQSTYRALGEKSFGELKGAEIEAQKALARGLKEEIAAAVPEVRTLNAQESALLNALNLTERRLMVSANKNPAGLGWLTTSPGKFAAWMADRSELFKSLVARMLNTASEAVPAMNVAGPIAGAAISQEAAPPNSLARFIGQ